MIEVIPGYFVTEYGKVYSQRSGKFLKPQKHRHGYDLYSMPKNGKFGWYLSHRLVAMAYIPNPEGHPLVCHKDDDPSNNHVDNLYWGTKSSNLKDAYKNGLKSVTEDQKLKMREGRCRK